MGRALGIDYGERRVGVALSDEGRVFAQALKTIPRSRQDEVSLLQELKRLIEEHEVTLIVIGWPLRLNGKEGIQTQKVARFINVIEPLGLPIERWDERLTTHSAERSLREGGVRGASQRQVVDQVAAAIILQAWLDAQSYSST